MPRTTRTRKAEGQDIGPAAVEPETEAPASEATSGEQDPAAALTAAYTQAIDARDQATGVIPAVDIDAVRVAYGKVPKRQRAKLVTTLTGAAGDNATTDDGAVDTGLAVAVFTLSRVFAQVDTLEERPDPVPAVAGILAALDQVRAETLGDLSDDQRARLAELDASADEAAQAASEATLTAVRKVSARALNGRARPGTVTRAPARQVAEKIQNAVTEEPITLSELAAKTGLPPATLWSRWKDNNTPGVTTFEDDQGRKLFRAA